MRFYCFTKSALEADFYFFGMEFELKKFQIVLLVIFWYTHSMRIALCGSMVFASDILDAKKALEQLNHTVIFPKGTEKYAGGELHAETKWEKVEGDVIREYFEEIKLCDAILVVNKTKGEIENYIGGNVLIEIAFAHVLGKKIFLLHLIPTTLSYTDEIISMKPSVIDGDFSKIS